jgi:hypothetical protein
LQLFSQTSLGNSRVMYVDLYHSLFEYLQKTVFDIQAVMV